MYSYLIGGVVAIALLAGTLFFGIDIGEVRERTKWQDRENEELAGANQQIVDLTAKIRKAEEDHAKRVNAISTQYQQELQRAKLQRETDRIAVSTGTLRLFDPACREKNRGATTGKAGPGASGRDGGESCELPGKTVNFLLGLVADADEITLQLWRCQDVVKADRL